MIELKIKKKWKNKLTSHQITIWQEYGEMWRKIQIGDGNGRWITIFYGRDKEFYDWVKN